MSDSDFLRQRKCSKPDRRSAVQSVRDDDDRFELSSFASSDGGKLANRRRNEYVDADKFLSDHRVTKCNSLFTILQSVLQTQSKKSFSYQIGVATIFIVSTFVTVLLSATSLSSIIFFQMGQSSSSDIDIILLSQSSPDTLINLNTNPYAVNPFKAAQALQQQIFVDETRNASGAAAAEGAQQPP